VSFFYLFIGVSQKISSQKGKASCLKKKIFFCIHPFKEWAEIQRKRDKIFGKEVLI
jgi:hypothetical protein